MLGAKHLNRGRFLRGMYDLNLEKMAAAVRDHAPKRILVQLPDGLKARAPEIRDRLARETEAPVLFWAGSNFGACDMPLSVDKMGVDLLIHVGHSAWRF